VNITLLTKLQSESAVRISHRQSSAFMRYLGVGILAIALPVAIQLFFGFSIVAIATSSMEPSMSAGDLSVVRSVSAADLHIGDVVLLRDPLYDVTYSHRIIRIGRDNQSLSVVTKGDANPVNDANVVVLSSDSKIASSVFVIPKMGILFSMFSTSLARMMLLLLLAVSGAFWFIDHKPNHRNQGEND
jgi:signal peptidase